MSTQNKFALRMSADTQAMVKSLFAQDNCRSQNEFIEKAVRFYAGYLQTKNSAAFLSTTLLDVIKGIVDHATHRTNSSLFKLSVEVSMLAHAVAYTTEPSEDNLRQLRAMCVNAVKNNRSPFRLKKQTKSRMANSSSTASFAKNLFSITKAIRSIVMTLPL